MIGPFGSIAFLADSPPALNSVKRNEHRRHLTFLRSSSLRKSNSSGVLVWTEITPEVELKHSSGGRLFLKHSLKSIRVDAA